MNETLEGSAQAAERSAASERPRRSGFVIKPIDKDAAIALLQSFYDEDPKDVCLEPA